MSGIEKFLASKWFNAAAAALICALALAVYYPVFGASFQFDDLNVLFQGPAIARPSELASVITGPRGLSMLTFAVNHAVSGADPRAYHMTNVAMHIASSVAAYFFVLLTFELTNINPARARLMALGAAVLFAIHPLQTSAVSYVIQRMEVLSGLLYLLALIALARAGAVQGKTRWAWYALIIILYAAAFQAKESAITLPAVALLYDYFFISKGRVKSASARWSLYAALSAMLIFFSVHTFANLARSSEALGKDAGKAASLYSAALQKNRQTEPGTARDHNTQRSVSAGFELKTITPKEYLYTQFNVVLYYLTLLALPINQNVDHDFPVSKNFFNSPATSPGAALNYPIPPPALSLAVLLLIAGGAAMLYYYGKNSPGPALVSAFFIFWFFIIVSPTSSFVPISDVIFEHRVYLASLGFFAIITVVIDALVNMSLGRINGPNMRNPEKL